jgi:hypothetical protein
MRPSVKSGELLSQSSEDMRKLYRENSSTKFEFKNTKSLADSATFRPYPLFYTVLINILNQVGSLVIITTRYGN